LVRRQRYESKNSRRANPADHSPSAAQAAGGDDSVYATITHISRPSITGENQQSYKRQNFS